MSMSQCHVFARFRPFLFESAEDSHGGLPSSSNWAHSKKSQLKALSDWRVAYRSPTFTLVEEREEALAYLLWPGVKPE